MFYFYFVVLKYRLCGGDWIKQVKGLVKEHVSISHGHGQWCGECQGMGRWGWMEVGKRGKWGKSAIVSTLNILNKN